MPRIKISEKKMKHATHGFQSKKYAHCKIAIRGGKTASKSIIAAVNTPRIDTPTIQVSESITEAQRKRLERSGIKIVTVEDMVKRRGENVAAFRKMEKPGYAFSGSSIGGKLK